MEKIFGERLAGPVEIKTERNHWQRTQRITVEYESGGKPSGILTCQCPAWVHQFCDRDTEELLFSLVVPTHTMYDIHKLYRDTQYDIEMGETINGKKGKGVLIPLPELLEHLSEYRDGR
jgi:hypothetical protein